MIAFGGFRVLASDPAVDDAIAVLGRYANGDFALADDDQENCPQCGTSPVLHDPQPRRNVFLAICVLPLFEVVTWSWLANSTAEPVVAVFGLQVMACLSLPWFAVRYFKWRMRCAACGGAVGGRRRSGMRISRAWLSPARGPNADLGRYAGGSSSRRAAGAVSRCRDDAATPDFCALHVRSCARSRRPRGAGCRRCALFPQAQHDACRAAPP